MNVHWKTFVTKFNTCEYYLKDESPSRISVVSRGNRSTSLAAPELDSDDGGAKHVLYEGSGQLGLKLIAEG